MFYMEINTTFVTTRKKFFFPSFQSQLINYMRKGKNMKRKKVLLLAQQKTTTTKKKTTSISAKKKPKKKTLLFAR